MSRRPDEDLPLSRQKPVHEDVRGEVQFHIDQRTRDLEAEGLAPDEARRRALEAFGDLDSVEAECREIETRRRVARRRAQRLDDLKDDLRLGFRLLRRSPAFTIAAVVTLALGIGANTAVFSIVDDVILTPLAFQDADRLVTVSERHDKGWGNLAWTTFVEAREQATSYDGMTQYAAWNATVLGTERPLRATVGWMSADFFTVFPTRPLLGRLPLPEEHQIGATPVAVISHDFWRDQLGAPASLDSLHLKVDASVTVIGVLPPGYRVPEDADMWLPIELLRHSPSHTSHGSTTVGRLRPQVNPIAAQREMDGLLARMKEQYYPDFDAIGSTVEPLVDVMTASSKTPLYLLLGASTVLLLAACTNLASAGLARGTARTGELAVRSALGASRMRIVRQLLTESALLSLLGCLAGLLTARFLLRVALPLAPEGLGLDRIGIDARVLAFAGVVAVITTMLAGLLPALRLSDTGTGTVLRAGLRGTGDGRRTRAWNVLVGAEVALAVVLLSGAGLLLRSFSRVMQTDLGFDATGVLATTVELPAVNYDATGSAIPSFHDRTLSVLSAAPGIEAVGFANVLPLGGAGLNGAMEIEGKPHDPRGPFSGYSVYRVIGGDYFRALGIRVIAGRSFGPGDDRRGAPVVIVSETFARLEWPGENAVGKRLRPFGMDGLDEPWYTVVGVVGDTRTASVTDRHREVYYFDYRQRPAFRAGSVTYVARSGASAPPAAATIQRLVASIDPQVPIEQLSLSRLVSQSVADRRFTLLVLAAFAAVALLLAIVGIYAVISYTVAQRTREFGVRLALGASPGRVRLLVLLTSMRSVVPGLVVGTALAVAATSAMRSLLYGVSPLDPVALGAAVVTLGLAGMGSSMGPALRATRVDPLAAIRAD